MKVFKRILSAFNGAALYMDKSMLKALGVTTKDEVAIDIQPGKLIITKPMIDADKIKEILDAKFNTEL